MQVRPTLTLLQVCFLISNRKVIPKTVDVMAACTAFSPSNTRQTPSQTAPSLILGSRVPVRSTIHFLYGPGKTPYCQWRLRRG